ncbi:MAG: P27 family phage terminase small subunit [Staphylococcus pseudoxylosus]|uniref:P27 family phage terminase small subunit n=1 Tax=Staphylococcus pseudoxylosus TaxID=2282419 RepID=UPI0031F65D08
MDDDIKLSNEQVQAITNTRNWLMQQIDQTNDLEIEKVDRYCNLLDIFYYLDNEIYVRGPVIEVGNGNQTFVKPNPCLAEKNKINGSLLAIEKSFNLEKRAEEKRKAEASKGVELT